MSAVATSKAAGGPVEGSSSGSLLSAPAISMALLLAVGVAALFWDWLLRQNRFSSEQSEDWSHAYLVPLISVYMVYQRRRELAQLAARTYWPGVVPLLTGVACYFFFTLTAAPGVHLFQGLSLVLVVTGIVLTLFGAGMFTHLAFPCAYLSFAVTVPEMVMNYITFKLQVIATQGAHVVLLMLGLTVDRAGNTLTILTSGGEEIPLNVAEACSGMRMVVAFLALGVAVAYVSCPRWWQRTALILLATPVALLTNVVRVASLGLASVVNPGFAEGEAHTLIGVLWLIPGFLLYMLIAWALRKIVRDEGPTGAAS